MTPLVELLDDRQTDADRAGWLLRVPCGVIHREHMAIRRLLCASRFLVGAEALDAEFAAINAIRMPDGTLPPAVGAGVDTARLRLLDVVRKGFGDGA